MADGASLDFAVTYSGRAGSVRWEGRSVDRQEQFGRYVIEVVRPRLADDESSFGSELLGLATTGVETRFVERGAAGGPGAEGMGGR